MLLLAGAFEPVDQARAEQVRCDGVLIKPFEPRQVIERVRELLEGVKGSPAQATADVPRPVERLSPRPGAAAVPAPPRGRAARPRRTAPAAAPPSRRRSSRRDLALDEYFESLNAAFDSVGTRPAIRRRASRRRRRGAAAPQSPVDARRHAPGGAAATRWTTTSIA